MSGAAAGKQRTSASVLRPSALLLALALASCQVVDLGKACLPIRAPATVQLARDVHAVYGIDADLRLDPSAPNNLDTILPAGTSLRIERITQRVQFDSSNPDIEVSGRLDDGRTFLYRWGYGRSYFRAPWEPATTPELREAPCAHG